MMIWYQCVIISIVSVYINIYPCPNLSGGEGRAPIKLGHGWVITSHINKLMVLFIHAHIYLLISVSKRSHSAKDVKRDRGENNLISQVLWCRVMRISSHFRYMLPVCFMSALVCMQCTPRYGAEIWTLLPVMFFCEDGVWNIWLHKSYLHYKETMELYGCALFLRRWLFVWKCRIETRCMLLVLDKLWYCLCSIITHLKILSFKDTGRLFLKQSNTFPGKIVDP